MGSEKQAIVYVQAFGVGLAFCPWLDVASTQKARLGNAGNRTACTPIRHQSLTKNVLSDALNNQPLSFGRTRQIACLSFKGAQRFNRQGASQTPDLAHQVMQGGVSATTNAVKPAGTDGITVSRTRLPTLDQIGGDARVIDSDHVVWPGACQSDRRRSSQAVVGKPLPVIRALQAKPFVNCGFVQTDAFDGESAMAHTPFRRWTAAR